MRGPESIPSLRLNMQSDVSLVVSLINGLGDTLLALPVFRRLAALVGNDPSRLFLWVADDTLRIGLDALPATLCSVRIDRHADSIFRDSHADIWSALRNMADCRNIWWVSLNAYWPYWEPDLRLFEAVAPARVWSFSPSPEMFGMDILGRIVPMREQYLRVVGETRPATRAERRPLLRLESVQTARRQLHGAQIHGEFLAIHTDSEEPKQWSSTKWKQLVQRVKSRLGLKAISVGYPDAQLKDVPAIVGDWDVHMAVVELATAFVGIDSCFAHVADAANVAGVVLFGPTDPQVWGPEGPAMQALVAPRNDMALLEPDVVVDALRTSLEVVPLPVGCWNDASD